MFAWLLRPPEEDADFDPSLSYRGSRAFTRGEAEGLVRACSGVAGGSSGVIGRC
jgi:hypothetical protein